MEQLYKLWESAFVRRWHNKPYVPQQTIGQHTFGMCLLLMKLHPNPSAALYEAIIQHDGGEYDGIGFDIPYPAKRDNPELQKLDDSFTPKFIAYFSLRTPELTEDDKLWLKYLDQLESMLYCMSLSSNDGRVTNIIEESKERCAGMAETLTRSGYNLSELL